MLTVLKMPRRRDVVDEDTNGVIAALLRDLAAVQTSPAGRWGYKRAAAAISGLDRRIETYDLARRALAAGCLFALDSDAHGAADFSFAETAIAHARLARIPPDRVVNCWRLDRLLEWLALGRPPSTTNAPSAPDDRV